MPRPTVDSVSPSDLELAVGVGDRLAVHAELLREHADRLELGARLQPPGLDRPPQVVDDLPKDRLRPASFERNDHAWTLGPAIVRVKFNPDGT